MTHDAAPAILKVEDLTTSFLLDGQWRSVVRHVGFEVRPRETVALVGESGSGKSVTALSIMRLLPAGASRIGDASRSTVAMSCPCRMPRCGRCAAMTAR